MTEQKLKELLADMTPVSYTHLDVYKRQDLSMAFQVRSSEAAFRLFS